MREIRIATHKQLKLIHYIIALLVPLVFIAYIFIFFSNSETLRLVSICIVTMILLTVVGVIYNDIYGKEEFVSEINISDEKFKLIYKKGRKSTQVLEILRDEISSIDIYAKIFTGKHITPSNSGIIGFLVDIAFKEYKSAVIVETKILLLNGKIIKFRMPRNPALKEVTSYIEGFILNKQYLPYFRYRVKPGNRFADQVIYYLNYIEMHNTKPVFAYAAVNKLRIAYCIILAVVFIWVFFYI